LLDFLLFFRIIFTGLGRRAFGTWGRGDGGGFLKKRFGIYICFGFKVVGFGEGCFWIFFLKTILGERGGGGC
jgi:hypothetical protein